MAPIDPLVYGSYYEGDQMMNGFCGVRYLVSELYLQIQHDVKRNQRKAEMVNK